MNFALTKALFILTLLAMLLPWVGPATALVAGTLLALALGNPYPKESRRYSRYLLQGSVVALGFGMNLRQVLRAGTTGLLYTCLGIVFALGVGTLLGRQLKVAGRPSFLISVGTAICGGSAIAAVGPIIQATDEEMSVSLSTVFLLNAAGLLLFPAIGHRLRMSQQSFGLWAALAVHDTSSVVGATAKYGAVALAVGTSVKLARALWIVPVSLLTAAFRKSKEKVRLPWFIVYFLLAVLLSSYVDAGRHTFDLLASAGRLGLKVTLFFIGAGLTRASLRSVGIRPLLQGVILWLLVAIFSFFLVNSGIAGI